jgi:ABC-type nitrate/sulfonate/bicarbonate transport system ATPase subunit
MMYANRKSGGGQRALEDFSIGVKRSEFCSIVGPSGCGKSTLFRLISGLEHATEGEVLVGEAQVDGPAGAVAYMFQHDMLVEWRDVLGNATFGGEIAGIDRRRLRAEALEWLDALHLSEYAHARPHELSGGMRQRVALARTLLTERPVLLLDEPFGALDSLTRRQMHALVLEVWNRLDRTVLLVTHDIEEALLLSDRVYVMSGRPGRIVATVNVDFGRPRSGDLASSHDFFELRTKVLDVLTENSQGSGT